MDDFWTGEPTAKEAVSRDLSSDSLQQRAPVLRIHIGDLLQRGLGRGIHPVEISNQVTKALRARRLQRGSHEREYCGGKRRGHSPKQHGRRDDALDHGLSCAIRGEFDVLPIRGRRV